MDTRSRSDQIAAELRDEILRARYREGERLPSERDLALRFDVHRGTIREALKKLEQLGLAQIKPGGARVAPIDEASLDVVGHLLGLDDPPDPAMVEQVLEMFSGLFAVSARLAAERADEAGRQRVKGILARLSEETLEPGAEYDLFQDLGDAFVDASNNMVMKLVRRGLKPHFIERFLADRDLIHPPAEVRIPLVRQLSDAFDARDGSAASEMIFRITVAIRRSVVAHLEAERGAGSDSVEAARPRREAS